MFLVVHCPTIFHISFQQKSPRRTQRMSTVSMATLFLPMQVDKMGDYYTIQQNREQTYPYSLMKWIYLSNQMITDFTTIIIIEQLLGMIGCATVVLECFLFIVGFFIFFLDFFGARGVPLCFLLHVGRELFSVPILHSSSERFLLLKYCGFCVPYLLCILWTCIALWLFYKAFCYAVLNKLVHGRLLESRRERM